MRTLPLALLASLLATGCTPSTGFETFLTLLVDEAQDPLAAAATIRVDVIYPDGDPVSGEVDPLSGEQRLEGLREGVDVFIEVTVLDSGGTAIALGRSLALEIADGAEAAVFVGATGELARVPTGLSDARTFAKAVLTTGDRVVVVGGGDNADVTIEPVEFVGWSADDPFGGVPGADLPLIGHQAIWVPRSVGGPWAGRVAVIGGTQGSGQDHMAGAWQDGNGFVSTIDPETGEVDREADELTREHMEHRAVWAGDRIALLGGFNAAGQYAEDIWLINPLNGDDARGPEAPIREQHAVTDLSSPDNPLFLASGGVTGGGPRGDLYLWDGGEEAGSIDTLDGIALAVPRMRHQATRLSDGRVLFTGGATGDSSVGEADQGDPTNTAEVFDPVFRSLAETEGAMLVERQRHVSVLLPDERVLVCAGEDDTGAALGSCEVYLPDEDVFEAFTGGSMSPGGPGIAAVPFPDGRVLFIGGASGSGPDDTLHLYTPPALLHPGG